MTNRVKGPSQWNDVQAGNADGFEPMWSTETCADDCYYCTGPETD